MGFSRHAPTLSSSTAASERKVFTLYWRPLRMSLSLLLALPAALLSSCRRTPPVPQLFVAVAPEASGITFANTLPEDSALNIVNYLYYYNGGGVAAGERKVFTLYWRPLRMSLSLLLALPAALLSSCRRTPPVPQLFVAVAPEASGITFANTLPEDSALNIVNYLYYYNGGGVAAG